MQLLCSRLQWSAIALELIIHSDSKTLEQENVDGLTPIQAESSSPQISLSESALTKVQALLVDEDNSELKLRVFISGGGCSGFSYGFTFDDEVAEDDAVIERDGVTLLVDSLSYEYLLGSVVDYKEDLSGAAFVVSNPNASSTCGCGNSFAV